MRPESAVAAVPTSGSHLASASHSLELVEIVKRYGNHAAIDGVSIQVARGDFLTLLGPSGSGKTTLLMSVAGFVEPDSGRILLDSSDITGMPPELRDFGMVFQGYALFPHMTVTQNIAFPLRVRGIKGAKSDALVRQMLDLVQLGEFGARLPAQLSGGQQQRVALARALVFQPNLLLLDEPLSALDKSLRADVQWELRSLHRRLGTTFIYVTHDQEEALSMSNRIAILNKGKVEQIGSPVELYSRPRSRFVASFLGESNFFTGEWSGADNGGFVIRAAEHLFRCGGACEPNNGLEPRRVTVAVRPEHIALTLNRPAGPNVISGSVVDLKYLGATVQVKVDSPGLGAVTASVPADGLDMLVEPGAQVYLAWSAHACMAVRE